MNLLVRVEDQYRYWLLVRATVVVVLVMGPFTDTGLLRLNDRLGMGRE
jgi:hypothetical protein